MPINEKVQKIEQLKKQMIEQVIDYAIILLDIDGTILTWNKGAEAIKGYREEEIVGQNFSIFYTPEDRASQLPQKLLQQASREGRAKYIGRRVRKNGTLFWGVMLLTALHDESNQVIGFTKLTRIWKEDKTPTPPLNSMYAREQWQ